jgi:cell division septation protein DedD
MRVAALTVALAAGIAALAVLPAAAQGIGGEYGALLSYASTLPAKDALKMADSLSRAQNAPGRVKAMGLRILGDNSFLKEDYKSAADAYLQASKLDSASTCRHLYALAAAMNGQPETAREIWNRIAADNADKLSGEAALMLTHLPKPPEAPPVAAVPPPPPQTAAPVIQQNNPPAPPPPPATAAKTDDAKKPPPAATPAIQQNNPPAPPPPATAAKIDDANKPTEGLYTIQVGAFASKENADNLVARLKGKYEDIAVSATVSGDQTLYRVRVGPFPRKEDAVVFADKLIIEAGLSARVTEK